MPNQGTDYGERYLSGSNLIDLYGDRVKLPTVNKWVESGKVSTDSDGRRNEQQVLIALLDAKDAEIERQKSLKTVGDLREEIDKAKLRKILLEGDIIELQRDKEKGELIRLDEAIIERKDTDTRIKQKLLSLPSRISLELSGISDPIEIQKILDEFVRELLLELHTELYGGSDEKENCRG
jgi:phage terminase Nu1 subunit (DNA packaging protein)